MKTTKKKTKSKPKSGRGSQGKAAGESPHDGPSQPKQTTDQEDLNRALGIDGKAPDDIEKIVDGESEPRHVGRPSNVEKEVADELKRQNAVNELKPMMVEVVSAWGDVTFYPGGFNKDETDRLSSAYSEAASHWMPSVDAKWGALILAAIATLSCAKSALNRNKPLRADHVDIEVTDPKKEVPEEVRDLVYKAPELWTQGDRLRWKQAGQKPIV